MASETREQTERSYDGSSNRQDPAQERSRLLPGQIFARVKEEGRTELDRPWFSLASSGFGAGLMMGLSALGVAMLASFVGTGDVGHVVSTTLYPLGFITVVLGRSLLFTEHTLYPVVLVLEEREGLPATLRLWAIVLATNVLGAALFALVIARTSAVPGSIRGEIVTLGIEATAKQLTTVFWSAVIAGWMIALVAWLVTSTTSTSAQFVITWIVTFAVGLGGFAHSIATSSEILTGVWGGRLSLGTYASWLVPAVAGNVVGGVVAVSLLNYGQIAAESER
jgi:formate-nitrite transporter family protein